MQKVALFRVELIFCVFIQFKWNDDQLSGQLAAIIEFNSYTQQQHRNRCTDKRNRLPQIVVDESIYFLNGHPENKYINIYHSDLIVIYEIHAHLMHVSISCVLCVYAEWNGCDFSLKAFKFELDFPLRWNVPQANGIGWNGTCVTFRLSYYISLSLSVCCWCGGTVCRFLLRHHYFRG